MLARWVGRGEDATVTSLSERYDVQQDGTTATDLRAAITYLGLTHTLVDKYPYIALVSYPKLPVRYDKSFTGQHWIVRLSDERYHDPLWPGVQGADIVTAKATLDAAERGVRVGIEEVPGEGGDGGGNGGTTKAPPVATIIRPPYGKTYHVCVGGTQAQRDAVYLLASKAGHSATCSADDGALVLLQNTLAGVTEFALRTIYFYGVAADQQTAFRNFVAGAYPGTKAAVVEFRAWPGEAKPAITMTATPTSITAGQSSTVTWSAPQAASATLNGAAVATSQSTTVTPTVNTTYTLIAKYADTTTQTKTVVVAVSPFVPPPPPPPPPPLPVGIKLGVNVLANHQIAFDYAARGCRYFLIFDNFGVAAQLKRQYPDAVIVHRHYVGWSMGGQALADHMMAGEMHPGVIYETLNEQDHGAAYGSVTELKNRLDAELSAAQIVRQRGYMVSLGGYSMGTPDFWDAGIIDEFKRRVAPLYNNDPGIYIGFHLYTRKYDMDFDIWYARRWQRLFEVCGFDPAKRKVLCSETGVDEGGVGGFPAHAYTIAQFRSWCSSWLSCEAQPVMGLPSQILGGAIFQVGNRDSGSGGWAGYNIEGYIPVLAEFWK